jgi:rhamnosyltransferase
MVDNFFISIVIPTLNGGSLLKDCVHKIADQVCEFKFELIVIDSGSIDNSLDYIKSYCTKNFIEFKIVSINKRDFSHGNTRNQAVLESSGDIIVFLTQDAVPFDQFWLLNLVNPFIDSSVCATFGNHTAHINHPTLIKRNIDQHFQSMNKYAVRCLNDFRRYESDIKYRQMLHFFSNNNSAIRKKMLTRIPFPNVSYGEDQIWADLALKKGYKIVYSPDSKVYHSHYWNLIQIFKRSCTEINYFKRNFGYDLTLKPTKILSRSLKSIFKDLHWMYTNKELSYKNLHFTLNFNLGTNLARCYCFAKIS